MPGRELSQASWCSILRLLLLLILGSTLNGLLLYSSSFAPDGGILVLHPRGKARTRPGQLHMLLLRKALRQVLLEARYQLADFCELLLRLMPEHQGLLVLDTRRLGDTHYVLEGTSYQIYKH